MPSRSKRSDRFVDRERLLAAMGNCRVPPDTILALHAQGQLLGVQVWPAIWVPQLSYGLVHYFCSEAAGWMISAYGRAESSVVVQAEGAVAVAPTHESVIGDICMALMAASMAYMFAGMN